MSWRRLFLYASGATIAAVAAALVFAWSGLYSVAASEGHWAVVDALLRLGMKNSVETQAAGIVATDVDDIDMVKLGAAHFERGCRACHGAPGHVPNPIMQQTLPPAPPLGDKIAHWRDRELFWLVKNGLKYTAMPGWTAQERADEIWSVVAFLKQLPSLDQQTYAALAGTGLQGSRPRVQPAGAGTLLATERGCVACHGGEGLAPNSTLVPILHGQSEEMIAAALQSYAQGQRTSGVMQPIATQLTPNEMQRLGAEYAAALPNDEPQSKTELTTVEAGRNLFEEGDAQRNIPACRACHAPEALPQYPRLEGQNARYVAGQLRLWKNGGRTAGELAAIMAPIAQRLSDGDIDNVSAYLASRPLQVRK